MHTIIMSPLSQVIIQDIKKQTVCVQRQERFYINSKFITQFLKKHLFHIDVLYIFIIWFEKL